MEEVERKYCSKCPNFQGGWLRRLLAKNNIIKSNKNCEGPLFQKFEGGVVVNMAGQKESKAVHLLATQCSVEYPSELTQLEQEYRVAQQDLWSGAAEEGIRYFTYPGGVVFDIKNRINSEGKVE